MTGTKQDGLVDDHLFVIIGGTGDLTRRKLLPALYHLSTRIPHINDLSLPGRGDSSVSRLVSCRARDESLEIFPNGGRGWPHQSLRAGIRPFSHPRKTRSLPVVVATSSSGQSPRFVSG